MTIDAAIELHRRLMEPMDLGRRSALVDLPPGVSAEELAVTWRECERYGYRLEDHGDAWRIAWVGVAEANAAAIRICDAVLGRPWADMDAALANAAVELELHKRLVYQTVRLGICAPWTQTSVNRHLFRGPPIPDIVGILGEPEARRRLDLYRRHLHLWRDDRLKANGKPAVDLD